MANQEGDQEPTHFFRAILSPENARMKIASDFVKYHGNTISENVFLQVDDGSLTWKLGVKRCEGQVWLADGWKEFAEYYSIKFAQILMFSYKGKSEFDVSIYDPSLMEIQYPGKASSKSGVEFDPSKVVESDEEETDDDNDDEEKVHEGDVDDEEDDDSEEEEEDDEEEEQEDDDDEEEEDNDDDEDDEKECSQRLQKSGKKFHATKSSEKRTRHTVNAGIPRRTVNAWIRTPRTQSAWTRVNARANAFNSSNPWFIVGMQPYYVAPTKCTLCIPKEHSRKYILGKENKGMFLVGEDGRRYSIKYYIGKQRLQVRLMHGWKDFVSKNRLQIGDVCVFELVDSIDMEYKVTIFRIAVEYDGEEEDDDGGNSRASQFSQRSPQEEVQQRAKAFHCQNPSFIATMHPSHLGSKTSLYVSLNHGRDYLLEKGGGQIRLSHGGKTWEGTYSIGAPPQYRVRLSADGWRPFMTANHLEVGDACVFELVDGAETRYEVAIFRVADCA